MAKTCVELIARVKALIGRTSSGSTLDIGAIIFDQLNEAQIRIVRRIPAIVDLIVKDITTLDAVTDQYVYDISDSTFDPPIAHVQGVWLMDAQESRFMRVMNRREFDIRFPSPEDNDSGMPYYLTRRANKIEFERGFSSEWNGFPIRVDYCKWAAPFESVASTETSELIDADKGLILYATAETLRLIAKGQAAVLNRASQERAFYEEWLSTYKEYHEIMTEED